MPTPGRLALRLAAAAAIGSGVVLTAASAHAAMTDVPDSGMPGHLQLAAGPYPFSIDDVSPGDTEDLFIEASLADVESSTLALQLRGWGPVVEHPSGVTISVSSCREPYAAGRCERGEASILATTALAPIEAGRSWVLENLQADAPRYLRVRLGLPETAGSDPSLEGLDGNFAVGLYASGASDAPKGEPPVSVSLPRTGVNVLAIGLVAGGAVLAGLTLQPARPRRQNAPRPGPGSTP
ncbi:hypothetical protein [Mycetocola sp. 2940]|uniref:hypothetical protein n=1 Tax=Mycetocola sp. 2940 TaxID=3156452 RepID=UPI003391C48F